MVDRSSTTAAVTRNSSAEPRAARPPSLLPAPRRRRGVEWLDEPGIDDAVRTAAIADVVRSNQLLGGSGAAVDAIAAAVDGAPMDSACVIVDVGSGLADIPAAVRSRLAACGRRATTIAVDRSFALLAASRDRVTYAVCADAGALPFRDGSVSVVAASQLLHHFEGAELAGLLGEMHRVAKDRVVVSDLRRSWIAAAGFWIASWLFRFHPVTRHDGIVSVMRGFTGAELFDHVRDATGAEPTVRSRFPYRVTASWPATKP